jgi:hypothetical protein
VRAPASHPVPINTNSAAPLPTDKPTAARLRNFIFAHPDRRIIIQKVHLLLAFWRHLGAISSHE